MTGCHGDIPRGLHSKLVADLYQRWRHLVHELAKFGIVGAVNTVLDFGLANLLYLGLGWPSMGAKSASVAVAATSSFFMNRHWTFRHRARTGLRREYTLFFLLNGVGLLIANVCILAVEQGLGKTGPLWFNIAQLAGLALGMVFRFTTYKRWVFVSPERAAARSLADGSVANADERAGVRFMGLFAEQLVHGRSRHGAGPDQRPSAGPAQSRRDRPTSALSSVAKALHRGQWTHRPDPRGLPSMGGPAPQRHLLGYVLQRLLSREERIRAAETDRRGAS
jgi:putative flippase GtrA